MIVNCPSCQTRFRIAPERISPSGARVRCSACKGVFHLSSAGAATPERRGEAPPPPVTPARHAGVAAPVERVGHAFASTDPFAPPPVPGATASGRAAEALRTLLASVPPAGSAGAATPAVGGLVLEETTPPVRAVPPPLTRRSAAPETAPGDAAEAPRSAPAPEEELEFTPSPAPAVPAAPPSVALQRATPPSEPVIHTAASALPKLRRPGIAAVAGNALSLALLLALTAGLLVWRGDVGRRVRGVATGSAARPVVLGGVRAGLYDTSGGSAVLVVRGEVRAERAVTGPVRVRVALVNRARTVAWADALAGASGTPEEVYAAGRPDDAAALRRALDARAAPALPAGGAAPFLVVFSPPLPDLSAVEVRTAAEPAQRP